MARRSQKNHDAGAASVDIYDVGAYVRLSAVDRKQKGDSIETQQAIINAFLLEKSGLELRDIYIDNGLSGQSFERPGFQRMLEDIERGKINCCVTKDLSRLGRNAMETGYYVEKFFPLNDIRFIAITDNYDSSDEKTGGIIVSIKNLINEIYALEVGRKIRATKQMHIRCGYFIGRFPPYGYLKNPDNKYRLIPDGYTAPIVTKIYEMAAEGQSVRTILDWINDSGFLPPKRYMHSIGLATEKEADGHIHWNKGVLYGILHNRVYCGDMVQGKYNTHSYVQKKVPKESWVITENTHDALVSRELYASVQMLWDKPGRMGEQFRASGTTSPDELNKTKYKTASSKNIFLRKVFCAHCGYTMRRARIDEKNHYFKCETRTYYQKDDCVLVRINERELKAKLVEGIKRQASVFSKGNKISALLQKADEADTAALNEIQAELQENNEILVSLYLDFSNGNITEAQYIDLKQTVSLQASKMNTEQERLKKNIRERRYLNASRNIASALFQSVKKRNDLNFEIINQLVEKIKIYENKEIEVIFKFRKEAESCSMAYCAELIKITGWSRRQESAAARPCNPGGADNA
jgi:DNA invertase Pin-like site-specific DNA recombinase